MKLLGVGHSFTQATLSGSVATPSAETLCPRYFISRWKNRHFSVFSFKPASWSLLNTFSNRLMCSSYVAEKITMSSKYNKHSLRFISPMQTSMSLWNVAGAFVSPNGIRSHSKNPRLPTTKAVLALSCSSNSTCQYELFRSRVVNKVHGGHQMTPRFWVWRRRP